MPYPAVDNQSSTPATGRYTLSWYGQPPMYDDPVTTGYLKVDLLRKPATTVNPVRPDGTRAMSGYSSSWCRFAPRKVGTLTVTDGGGGRVQTWTNVPPVRAPAHWQDVQATLPFSPFLRFGAENEALTNVLGKLHQRKWDLGTSALELRQTAGLVTDLAVQTVQTLQRIGGIRKSARRQVNSLFRQVRQHGDFYQAAAEVGLRDTRLLERIKDQWMQYQFGIKPLVRDVHDASTYLSDRMVKGATLLAVGKAGSRRIEPFRANGFTLRPTYHQDVTVVGTEECRVHYSTVYEVPTDGVRDLTLLGLDNPWAIGWEVTRLSWLVDYVVDIGSWLTSFTAANGLVFREGSKSVMKRIVVNQVTTNYVGGDSFSYTGSGAVYLERGEFSRELLTHGLTPAVLPSVRKELGLTQMGNALFALSSVFSGRPGLR